MPVIESYEDGIPSWIDLSTSDPAAAQAFYGALFGWSYTEVPTGDQGVYIMAAKGDHVAAGMMQQAPQQAEMGIPPFWNTYVTCRDIEGTLGKVDAAGGSVMMPAMDVMDAGRMAVIVDPTGAVIALWDPKDRIGCEVVNEHGGLMWSEVMTPGLDAAAAFYGSVFGWEIEVADMANGPYTMFKVGDRPIGGGMVPPEEGIPPMWSVIFAVDDCAVAIASATEHGGTLLNGPMDIGIGMLAIIQDPQGAVFQVLEPAEGEEPEDSTN